jgi:hypothetical protein
LFQLFQGADLDDPDFFFLDDDDDDIEEDGDTDDDDLERVEWLERRGRFGF